MQNAWLVIINPVSGGKAAPKRWAKIKPLFDAEQISYEEHVTQYRDHAAEIVRQKLIEGARKIMILGGDGTANDVINGVYTSGVDPSAVVVAMVPAGTGNDWVRTIGKPKDPKHLVSALERGQTFLHDVLIVRYQKENTTATRYCMNITGLGFEGAVARNIFLRSGKWQAGKLRYQLEILKTLFVYKHTQMQFSVDGKTEIITALSVALGNGKYNGGGLKQLPSAQFDDGKIDMTVITNMPKWKMITSLPKLQSGAHIGMREVRTFSGKQIQISSAPEVHIDADGEYIGTTPLHCVIADKQIQVLKW